MSLDNNPFKEFDVDYIWQPSQTFLNPHDEQLDFDYFAQFKNRLVIINFSSEHWNDFEQNVFEKLDQAGINFLLLTHDPVKHQRYPRMFYYPHWYYLSRKFWLPCYPDQLPINKNKTYALGCLNGISRTHRIANLLKLRKKTYWEKICVSFYNESMPRTDELTLTDDEIAAWEQLQSTLSNKPWTFTPLDKQRAHNEIFLPQLVDSCLHLVTETTVLPTIFISEKTWKPIATAVPFVIWGNPGTVSFLKSQGVDTYDDVIDHKYYDDEKDARSRLTKLHEVIDDLMLQGIEKIYNQLSDRAIQNQKKYFQGDFGQQYQNIVTEAINKYK